MEDMASMVTRGQGKAATDDHTKSFFAQVKAIDLDRRQVTITASTDTVDREGEVVLPSAIKSHLDIYMKNPVVLAAHMHRLEDGTSPVVANVVSTSFEKHAFVVVLQFHEETRIAGEYWRLYSKRIQRAVSIGFKGIKSHTEKRDGQNVLVWDEVELYEISCCAVPACPDALTRSAKRRADFIEGKRRERLADEDERLLDQVCKEMGKTREDLEKDTEEFAELMLTGDADTGEFMDGDIAALEDESLADLVAGTKSRRQRVEDSQEESADLAALIGGGMVTKQRDEEYAKTCVFAQLVTKGREQRNHFQWWR